jgi:DivIVA domain-containing protein
MRAMDFDRQAIERKDFPISRRGYDTAAVDGHLQALAAEFEELERAAVNGSGDMSLASTAGSQVQSILEAAETAAGEIERQALADAQPKRGGMSPRWRGSRRPCSSVSARWTAR